MAKTIDTGYLLKSNGQTIEADLINATHWNSARVRWKGLETTVGATNQNIIHLPSYRTTYPSVYGGYSFQYHFIYGSVTVLNTAAVPILVSRYLTTAEGTFTSDEYELAVGATRTFTVSRYEYGYHAGSYVSFGVMYDYESPIGTTTALYLLVQTQGSKIVKTTNPKIIIGGTTVQHVGILNVDEETSWNNIGSGFTIGQINNILCNMDSGSRAYVDIEYVYEPKLPITEQTFPEHKKRTTDTSIDFIFILEEDTDNSASKYHAKIRFDEYSTMLSPVTYESKVSQTSWEYWDGDSWEDFPVGGVDPGTSVKYTKTFTLGNQYWDTSSWDGYGYGFVGTSYKFKILLTVSNLYAVSIGESIYEADYDVFSLRVAETQNGEVGFIQMVLNNHLGETENAINNNDKVLVAFNDYLGNTEEFEGRVRSKQPNGVELIVTAILGDGILSERLVKEDYVSQDVGLVVKDIIDTYCQPLTSDNVDTSTGFVAPIVADGQTPLRVLEEIRKNYGLYFFVDKDWDVHLFLPGDIDDDPITQIRLGSMW